MTREHVTRGELYFYLVCMAVGVLVGSALRLL